MRTLTSKLQQQDILLDIVSIDEPGPDASFKAEKRQNKEALDQILPHVRHKVHSVRTPGEILSAFPYKEYSTTAYYSGPLTIANEMTIAVKVLPMPSDVTLTFHQVCQHGRNYCSASKGMPELLR